ncbi:helix-turn-helix domain-containing protein [Gluconacetobacter sacchari]|uniref:Helix-turn-helix domain-containing protein n=1 Tax=Gluconacetobacter sacchari TaxID=92759 RepID=A0A7W4IHG8_9PROT|nr:helix-turn-helix domain-containing protein [Gluconacetobacter sacchari]MBB2162936.1 helix-turn-helix domain-containing protein [Gluconacetobacter sacchari]
MIHELKRQGLGVSAIARQTCLDRKTVRRYLARGIEAPRYSPREENERIAERFRSYLLGRLEAYPGLSARRLHREITPMGYEG